MNNTIQTYDACLDTARDARAEAVKALFKGTFRAMRALLNHAEGILAAAYAAVALLAMTTLWAG